MDRLACVDVPALPLQLLLHANPEWGHLPVAVVDRDDAHGVLRWINGAAWRSRLKPGLRYTAALSIQGDLRAGTVSEEAMRESIEAIVGKLLLFSPRVEPSENEPGTFWVDASGLGSLYPDLGQWTKAVAGSLEELNLRASVVLGFSRFRTYALASNMAAAIEIDCGRGTTPRHAAADRSSILILDSPDEESSAVAKVPLERLGIAPRLRDRFARLGIHTVGALLELPASGVGRRFGQEARELHGMAAGRIGRTLRPLPAEEPASSSSLFEDPISSVGALVFAFKRMLEPLLKRLASHSEGISSLTLSLLLDRGPSSEHGETVEAELRTASPTLDEALVLNLIHLRLNQLQLRGGVREVRLIVHGLSISREQLEFFTNKPRRDLAAANRALARIRAELGEASIARARIRPGHLPEACFVWEKLAALQEAEPRLVRRRPLVRRIFDRPMILADPDLPYGHRTQGGHAPQSIAGHGRIDRLIGPYIISGGWWRREVHREYHFAETDRGELLWVYYDRLRRRWLLHGRVE